MSVAAFWVGCWFFSFSARQFGPQRKATLASSFCLQTALVLVSAALAQTHTAPAFGNTLEDPSSEFDLAQKLADEDHPAVYIVIALLAFQSSGQIVLSRALGLGEIPSVVVTSLYCDLISDPDLFQAPVSANVKRNRRVASVALLLAGGIAGGWLQRSSAGMAGALWIAAGMKLVIALAWMTWKRRDS